MMNVGYIERNADGTRDGFVDVDGVDLSPIEAMYFKKDGVDWLWLKRKPLLEWDEKREKFLQRPREPRWETYLRKENKEGVIAYRGTFIFLCFVYEITGIWDNVLGKQKERLNLYIERLPMKEQKLIINSVRMDNDK